MIFVDTSFWVAFRDRRDDRNREALNRMRSIGDHELVTTNDVRSETWTALVTRAGHASAVHFLDHLERSARVAVVRVSEEQEREAIAWSRRHNELPYSFVDATSFAVMRAMHIRSVLTFDDDFAAAGFTLLAADGGR